MKIFNFEKKWIITISAVVVAVIIGAVFFYERTSARVFTKSEYVKEVIVQNQSFNDLLDAFLDRVNSYDASSAATEKVEDYAAKFPLFLSALEENLGPKVPHESQEHYKKMIAAYKIYLEAVEMYKKAVPKNLGEERTNQMADAWARLSEARKTMKELG